jgi:hypothetical protein
MSPFLCEGRVAFPSLILFQEVTASPPWGRRERGWVFSLTPILTALRRDESPLSRWERAGAALSLSKR